MALDLRGVLLGGGPSEEPAMGLGASGAAMVDPAEEVARVAAARRPRLLRVYRRRLRFEDLEDCYSQATLELVARARRAPFANADHVANALELRFRSRIDDRRRAIEGRSAIEAAIAHAVPVDAPGNGAAELEDRGATVERQVFARTEMRVLRELIADLTRDQQLVLASQVLVDMQPAEFCARFAWSVEKYRKVAQRARIKLRCLVAEYEQGERCRRLEPDLLTFSAGIAEGVVLARARAHLANCTTCSRMVAALDRGAHSVGTPLAAPAAGGGLLAGVWAALRRVVGIARHPLAEAGASGGAGVGAGAGVAGGSLVGAAALKVGIAAVCVVGAAGTYAACSHFGVLPALGLVGASHRAKPRVHAAASVAPRRHGARPHRRSRAHRRRHGTRAVRATSQAVGQPVSHQVVTASSASRQHPARRLSTTAQIRREFGPPRSQVATAGAGPSGSAPAGSGPSTSSSAAASGQPAPGRAPPAQTAAQAGQTQAEFGFEK